uniref:mitogen-activated protein kinase kinase n=1 Tax=Aceria tosichella TaxID=561515 RepID=A0A6G1SC01_9ACAR
MPRPDAPRPAPLKMDRIVHRQEDSSNERLEDFFSLNRQIIGNLNPDDLITMGDLGRGNGGTVTKVKHVPSNQILARKVIRLEVSPAERNRIMQELEVLKDCNSEYIVGYFGAYQRNVEINLFMEYMDGRSLDSILSKTTRIPEDILGKITLSVIRGLTYLRDNLNIMHRDIKPSNILVNSHGQIKICDFGVSGQLKESIAQSFVGTRQYMSPERLTGESYKVQSDIWSLGLTLVELALGMYPIPQHDPLKMYEGEPSPEASKMPIFALMECIVNQPPPTIPGPPVFSSEFKDFVDKCLKKLPQERFDLRTIVQHKFVIEAESSNVDVAQWVCQIWSRVDNNS